MRKKGMALWVTVAVILLAWPGHPILAQGNPPPLPPQVDRDCSESSETCHLHIDYSYTSTYFVEDSVQESHPKPGAQGNNKTRRLHELRMFTKALPRRLMREAQLEEGSETSADGEARSYHDVFLSYVLGDYVNGEKRYVELCTSRNDGNDFHGEHRFRIEEVSGQDIGESAIMTTRIKGKDNVDYTRFRPASDGKAQGYDFVDKVKDRTRCGLATFPFGLARDPKLAPPPE